MLKTFTASFWALLLFAGAGAQAQTTLANWNMIGSLGPTATPGTSNAANAGKEVSAVGQTSAAFVTSLGAPTDPVFVANGWNVGAGNAW